MRSRGGVYLVRLAVAVCLLAGGCGGTSGEAAAITSTTTNTATTVPPTTGATTTTQLVLSGGYLAKAPFGALFLRVTKTGPRSFEGVAIYRFLRDHGPLNGQAALSGVTDGRDMVMQLTPTDTGPDGWLLGRNWSGSLDARTGGFTLEFPSPTTGELTAIYFRPSHQRGLQQRAQEGPPVGSCQGRADPRRAGTAARPPAGYCWTARTSTASVDQTRRGGEGPRPARGRPRHGGP